MILIDKLAYSSRLRRKSPALKTVFSVSSLLLCVAARSLPVSVCILSVMSVLTVKAGGIPPRRYGKLMAVPLGFLILSTVAVVFHLSAEPSVLFSIPLGARYLSADSASLLYGLRLVLTAFASISCLYFLSLTTPLTDIFAVLRRAHCPELILELMFLVYRFLFVLLETGSAIQTSQRCRLGNRDKRTELHAAGLLLAVLLQLAFSRSSGIYDAMESRCYDGRIRVLSRTCRATAGETAAAALLLALFAAAAGFGRFYGGAL